MANQRVNGYSFSQRCKITHVILSRGAATAAGLTYSLSANGQKADVPKVTSRVSVP